jgi:predicted NodU family carbamoyl transferase
MMDSIVLTLGHNSSAILVRDGHVLGGYETERFTGKKSDSSYPREPIEELFRRFDVDVEANLYIGHWFLDGKLPDNSNKYINYEHLAEYFTGDGEFDSLTPEFTHHDSHLQSAMVFAGNDFAPDYHAFVLDGFGTFGECISVYVVSGKSYKLVRRWFGFEHSLGMFYQYATAYMGMKQHNHEYKILAYEVHAKEFGQQDEIYLYAVKKANERVKALLRADMNSTYDPMISLEALPRIQLSISDELDEFCNEFNIDKTNEKEFRSQVSYYVQTVVESTVLSLMISFNPQDVLLAGGLFYNVKLNSLISQQTPGLTCVMPLAGDQGAGLGVYQHHRGNLVWPEDLFWGHRDLCFESEFPGIIVVDTMVEAMPFLESEIARIGFVNLVRGSMEFGPRALCNTTTLARPTLEVVDMINFINDRTSEMPMAPVMTESVAIQVFEDMDKVFKSCEYMIMARNYRRNALGLYPGAQHDYGDDLCTGRPQVTHDAYLRRLLAKFDNLLINTSFNYHGVPIVMTKEQIEYTHKMQNIKNPFLQLKTIVVKG